MIKKLPALCLGLVTAGALTALAYEAVKEAKMVPASAELADSPAKKMSVVGQTKKVPMRAPEGGYLPP